MSQKRDSSPLCNNLEEAETLIGTRLETLKHACSDALENASSVLENVLQVKVVRLPTLV